MSGEATLTVRLGTVALRARRRTVVVVAALVLTAVVIAVFALGVGEYAVPPGQVVAVLTGRDHSFAQVVVLQWRAPRIVTALAVGAALGLSGAIFQALTRNALGSPDVIGFNEGAYTGALVSIVLLGADYYRTAVGALVGGLVVAFAVLGLSRRRGGVAAGRLIVVGIAVSAVVSSVNQWIILRADLHKVVTAAVWAQGSLNDTEWQQAVPVLVATGSAVAVLCMVGLAFPVMQLGDHTAAALGVVVDRTRLVLLVVGVALVATAVAAAGPISFVALSAPQIARQLTGSPGVSLAPAAVTGAALLLGSDLVAVRVLAPTTLPVGAVTVCLGGAYLVYLLVRRRSSA